jgi:hypothetical protein
MVAAAGVLAALIGCSTQGRPEGAAASLQLAVALSVNAKGELTGAAESFDRDATAQVVIVVPVSNLRAGTLLSYVRYLDGKYVDNRTLKLPPGNKVFLFRYAAKPGQKLVAGHYVYKVYVNRRLAGTTEFTVTGGSITASPQSSGR